MYLLQSIFEYLTKAKGFASAMNYRLEPACDEQRFSKVISWTGQRGKRLLKRSFKELQLIHPTLYHFIKATMEISLISSPHTLASLK